MSVISRFRTISERDKSEAVQKLISYSTPDFDYFFFIVLAVIMATFGMLLDSAAIIIGSMLIAPIIYPALSCSLGIVMSDQTVLSRSFYALIKSFLLGVFASFVTALLFLPVDAENTGEIIQRINPSLEYLIVAVIAGMAVAYSLVKPKLSSTLIGIAVSVALIPPIAVLGIGLSQFSLEIVSGSFVLFVENLVGIIFASMLMFSLMNLYVKKKVAETAVKKEEKRMEQEKEKIEKLDEDKKAK